MHSIVQTIVYIFTVEPMHGMAAWPMGILITEPHLFVCLCLKCSTVSSTSEDEEETEDSYSVRDTKPKR